MHHTRSTFRQLIASVTVTALFVSSWAPTAAAQSGAPSGQTPPAEQAEPPPPEAAPSDEERQERARTSFEEAQKALEQEDYDVAYREFKAAHDLVPSPHAEYGIAVSLDLLGDRELEAVRAYQAFLKNPASVHVGEDKVAEVRQRLAELKAKLPARVTVITEPEGAQVSVNGQAQAGSTPLTLELFPGKNRIEAILPGHSPTTLELELEGGDEIEHRLTLEQAQVPATGTTSPPVDPEEKAERSLLPAYITLGIAGAGLVTGTLFGLKALSEKRDYDESPTIARADAVERNALLADMAFGIAVTLGITGLVLLTSDEPDAAEAAQTKKAQAKKKASGKSFAVAPIVAPNLGGAAARLTF